jgi:hypothetical protein
MLAETEQQPTNLSKRTTFTVAPVFIPELDFFLANVE